MIDRVKMHQKTRTAPEVRRSPLALAGLAAPDADFAAPTATTATAAVADPSLGHRFDQVRVDEDFAAPERPNERARAQVDEDQELVSGAPAHAGEVRTDGDAGDDADDD